MGNLDLGVSSNTLIEIAGLTAGTEYDQTDVSDDPGTGGLEGIATLSAGAIFNIDFFGGFNGALGDVTAGNFFDVLVADSIVGDIGTLIFDFSGAALASGLAWQTSFETVSGSRQALRLSVVNQETLALPAPGALPLFLAGLLGIFGLGRRARSRMAG